MPGQSQSIAPDRLRARLGHRQYRRRLAIEQGRILEHRRPVSPQLTAIKIHVAQPLLTLGLRLLGMYEHGNRQFRSLRVVRHDLLVRDLPAPFAGYTILHLSDLHIDLDPTLITPIAAALRDLRYDLCVLTGDYRNSTVGPCGPAVEAMLRLRAAIDAPVFAVLGNHDFLAMVPPLEREGIRFLLNESVALRRGEATLYLAGIDDPNIYRTHSLARALRHVPRTAAKVLLSHSPVIHREAARQGVQAVLAGHTHGGQVCLPGGRILIHNDDSPRQMLRGPWQFEDVHGYTSPGVGCCGLPVRFNCPPEVTLHRLCRPGSENQNVQRFSTPKLRIRR
ncbi:MAG: metallophosphoesterase [Kiritimatiellae bacterium]|nr:metallophosphoesterase [Kiritimatiellia bacterium]